MRFLKYFLLSLLILLIFMQGFIVPISAARLTWATVSIIAFLIVCCFINIKSFSRTIMKMYKYSPFKYILFFYLWIIFCGIIFILLGRVSLGRMTYFLIRFCLFSSVFIIFPVFLNKFISFKSIIKIILCVLLLAIGFALFQQIGEMLNISIFRDITNIFSNYKFEVDLNGMIDRISGKVRIRSFFPEPQGLAMYMCFMLPVVYSIVKSGCRVFKLPLVNKFFKIFIIPLMWLMLLLAKSPIYLIFSLIITIIYWFPKRIRNMRNIYICLGGCLFFIALLCFITVLTPGLLSNIVENSFLARISNSLVIFKNFDEFVMKEGSFAVRVVFQIKTDRGKTATVIVSTIAFVGEFAVRFV